MPALARASLSIAMKAANVGAEQDVPETVPD